ncbi:hypothetical protein COH21_006129 [Aspergillus flavus]|nr:hypothetical protein COH21_006129 [Aspergillus flavus]
METLKVAGGQNFDRALVRVYTANLNYTAEVNKGQNESFSTRMYHSILAISDHPLQQLKEKIEEERLGAEKWADFTNTLRNREAALDALNLLDKSLDILKNVNSKNESRASDTGKWLLEMKEYKDWKRSPGSVLWLPGIVGCGKSVLCSTVVQDIEGLCKEDASKSLAYWYFQFSYDESQSVDRMMRSVVRQLSRTPLAPSVSKTWEEHSRKGSQSDRKTTMGMLDGVLSSLPGDVYIVFDALDQCPQKPNHRERESLLSLLVSIAERYKENIHTLATSRPEQDISRTMKNFPSISLEQRLAKDVETFVRAQLDSGSLRELDADTKVLVIDILLLSRERRFRWADLQVKRLEDCRADDHIKEALRTIPDSLEATYQTIIHNVAEQDRSIAREILILMCSSAAPLDLQTVADSVSLRSSRHVMDICTTSLPSTSGEEVRLAHFSVKEFLVSEDAVGNICRFSERAAKDHLAKKTVDCISCQTEELNQEMAAIKPFFAYASCHWQAYVAALVDINPQNADLGRKIDSLFTEPTVYFNWSRIADSYAITNDNQWNKLRSECKPAIDRATEMGLVGPVDTPANQGADPLQSWKARSWCPLKRAALEGRLKIVELLLRKNITISTELAKALIGLVKHDVEVEHALEGVLKALLDRGVLQDTARGPSESISEHIVSYAMTNRYSGLLILNIFLDWRDRGLVSVPITGDVMRCAVVFSSPAEEMLELLSRRSQEELCISPTMFIDTGGLPMLFDGIAALARRRPAKLPLSDALLEGMAIKCDSATMHTLLQARPDTKVTEKILVAAAQNNLGVDMLKLLWPLREHGASITEDVLTSAAKSRSPIILKFLIDKLQPSVQLTETVMKSIIGNWECGLSMMKTILDDPRVTFEVSEPLISMAASTTQAPLEMLDLLVNNSETEVHITEDIVCAAAGNIVHSSSVLEYLSHLEARPLPVTEKVVMGAIRNPKTLEIMFEKCPNAPITDRVFLGACSYADQMRLLLDKPHGGLPIEKMVEKLSNNYLDSCVVLGLLFERNLLTVNEQLVETLAARYGPLNTLLNQRPDAPITQKVVLQTAKDPRSIRLLLDRRPRDVKITEEVMIATTRSGECLEIIQGISHHTGSVPITERIFREAMSYGQVDVVKWMFDQRPDLNITIESLFHEIWQDGSIE